MDDEHEHEHEPVKRYSEKEQEAYDMDVSMARLKAYGCTLSSRGCSLSIFALAWIAFTSWQQVEEEGHAVWLFFTAQMLSIVVMFLGHYITCIGDRLKAEISVYEVIRKLRPEPTDDVLSEGHDGSSTLGFLVDHGVNTCMGASIVSGLAIVFYIVAITAQNLL